MCQEEQEEDGDNPSSLEGQFDDRGGRKATPQRSERSTANEREVRSGKTPEKA